MIQLDLRLRITAAIAVVCLGIVSILGVTLYMASEDMEFALVEQLVSEELNFLIQHYQANPNHVPAFGPNVQYYIVHSSADEARLPPYVRGLAPGQYEIDIGEGRGDRDIAIRDIGTTRFIVVYDIGPYEEREREFRLLVLYSLVGVMIAALVVGYSLAGFLARQLSLLAQRVDTLEPDQAGVSLVSDGQDREVAILAKALDRYQIRIGELLRREQEFTANASHELRTPLTAIRTSAGLLAKDPSLSEKARERVRYINQASGYMAEHVQALLFLAREQDVTEREPVALRECVQDAVAALIDVIELKGLEFKLDVSPEATVEVNRLGLQVVLSNLIRNAAHYTDSGCIHVEYRSPQLLVSDSGRGIPPEHLVQIFERGYRGIGARDGLGIGLDIVKRVCVQSGWQIEARSTGGIGSTFIVTFPSATRSDSGA